MTLSDPPLAGAGHVRECNKAVAGRLAQLAEHLVYTEGVGGSNPSSPTILRLIADPYEGAP